MTRSALFAAVRPFAPDLRFTPAMIEAVDNLGDLFGLPREAPASIDGPDPELIAALKQDEGLRLTAYRDTVGVWTVGYGHAHVDPNTVWTQAKAEAQLVEDVDEHNAKLALALPWIGSLDPIRRRVLQNMAFNLGIGSAERGNGLLGFKNTLEYVRTGQYDRAAAGMLASKWAKQVKGRAIRLAEEMRTGAAK